MTASLTFPARAEAASSVLTQTLAMWRVQPGAFMVLGQAAGPLPKAGSARMTAQLGAPGVFRAEFWPLEGEAGYAFLAAIRVRHVADRADDAELVLRGARGGDRNIRLSLVAASSESGFGKQVGALAGAYAARIARFMLDMMASGENTDMRQPGAVLDAFLTHAGRSDGCIELILHVPQRCVLLQGWGVRPTEPVELLLPGSSLARHSACAGDFPRDDVTAPATGNVLVLPPELAGAMASLNKVFLLTGDELLCRHVVEPRMLNLTDSIGQIRHLLPRLNCPAPVQAMLRASLRPHFDGRDTLNTAGRPVRAAVDIAVSTTGGGGYLSGWLFDPACHVIELYLCAEGIDARLDNCWVRVPRADVSAGFRADPAFPLPPTEEFGFAVAIPMGPQPGQSAYLRLTFTNDEVAFVPVRFVDAGAPSVLTALLASVDLHKSSGVAVVTRHLAPFVAQMPPAQGRSGEILLRGPLERSQAIVVPLRSPALPRAFVANFLQDPAGDCEQIVFVCGPEWDHARRNALIELVRFYELPASIVGVAHTPRSGEAVREATALTEAESFLLACPNVVGSAPGWRAALFRAARTHRVICPTVLFEDRSLRFAGAKSITFLEQAPFVSTHAPFAGACADLVSSGQPTEVESGTFACCVIQRSAVPALAQASRFMTEAGQEAAFFFALRETGIRGVWTPSIRVSAPEEEPVLAAAILPLIDGWMLRQSWEGSSRCAS